MMASFVDAVGNGAGFLLIMLCLGAAREIIGTGTLFAGMEQLFGPAAAGLKITLIDNYSFLLALLPPGAFIGLGFLLAIKNNVDHRLAEKKKQAKLAPSAAG
jgi:electron transport complex protein RnfE